MVGQVLRRRALRIIWQQSNSGPRFTASFCLIRTLKCSIHTSSTYHTVSIACQASDLLLTSPPCVFSCARKIPACLLLSASVFVFNHSIPTVKGRHAATNAVQRIIVLTMAVFQISRRTVKSDMLRRSDERPDAPASLTSCNGKPGKRRGTKSTRVVRVIVWPTDTASAPPNWLRNTAMAVPTGISSSARTTEIAEYGICIAIPEPKPVTTRAPAQ